MEYNNLNFDQDDLLERKTFIKNLMQVVNEWNNFKHENDSIVIAVDAPWGSGKSYLLSMWKNWLISEENCDKNYCVSYYNAWENDDCDNPFIPLVYKLQQMDIYKENNLSEEVKLKSKSFLKSCGIALLKDGIKKTIGEETAELIVKGIDGAVEEKVENFFEKYKLYVEEKEKFRNALLELIPDNGKLIIFVDELDRCRPTFAIETLEIVKHYFNIMNIVFVFAIDLEQLSHSISTMYGNGMDSSGYLRRFFDVNINIPAGDIRRYIEIKFKSSIKNISFISGGFIDIAVNAYQKLKLTLRDIDKITNNFIVFCLFYHDNIIGISPSQRNTLEVFLFFIILKYKYPNVYNLILKQEFMTYDNGPKNRPVLELKFFISDNINKMLRDIQTGKAQKKDDSLINKYGIYNINSTGLSFAEHIERT